MSYVLRLNLGIDEEERPAVRIIDDARFELRCRCGANGVYNIAKVYLDRAVTCRTCRHRTELSANLIQALDDHISRVIAGVERGLRDKPVED